MRLNTKEIVVFIPLILATLLLFYFPIYTSFQKSLQDIDGSYIGFDRYGELFSNPEFTGAFTFTIQIALVSTVISAVLSVILALALRGTFAGKRISLFLNQMNISMPHMIVAVMVIYLVGRKGFISSLAYKLGFIDSWSEFPAMVESTSSTGVVLSYCLKFTPFICMSVLAVMQSMTQDCEDQSYILGVGKIKTFLHVTLPSIWPAIMSTVIMSFTYAFGSYDVPVALLKKGVMSTYVYNEFYSPVNPEGVLIGYAGAFTMTVIVLIISSVFLYLSSKGSDALE